jgi:hypothetical protein
LNPRRTFRHVRDFQSRSLGRSDTSPRPLRVAARRGRARGVGALAALALLGALAAGCGGGGSGTTTEAERSSGPVAALYVIDHGGADPVGGALAPYTRAFDRIKAGCAITGETIANRVLQISDSASKGSGTNVTNLEALRAIAREVPDAKGSCTRAFRDAEALLGGGAFGGSAFD